MRGHFDGRLGHAQATRHFTHRLVLELQGLNHLALTRRQQRHRRVDRIDVDLVANVRAAADRRVWQRVARHLTCRHAPFASQHVDQPVRCDGVKPRRERPPEVVGLPAAVHGQQRLLDDVIDPGHGAETRASELPRDRRQQRQQRRIRHLVAGLRELHEVGRPPLLLGGHRLAPSPDGTTDRMDDWLQGWTPRIEPAHEVTASCNREDRGSVLTFVRGTQYAHSTHDPARLAGLVMQREYRRRTLWPR